MGTSSMVFAAAVFRGEQRLVHGELVYVFADPATQTSRPVPPVLRETIMGYEAGEAMVTLKRGGWDALGTDAQRIRTEVFVQEQRIPQELEWDAADATALHAVAYNRLGEAVATGRLLPHGPGVVKIGRMAVNRVLRGGQVGRQVLHALMDAAAERGEREVMLHAQRSAEGFYRRLGFDQRGEPFEEAGIAHVEMFTRL